jgi:hypothetical protein
MLNKENTISRMWYKGPTKPKYDLEIEQWASIQKGIALVKKHFE